MSSRTVHLLLPRGCIIDLVIFTYSHLYSFHHICITVLEHLAILRDALKWDMNTHAGYTITLIPMFTFVSYACSAHDPHYRSARFNMRTSQTHANALTRLFFESFFMATFLLFLSAQALGSRTAYVSVKPGDVRDGLPSELWRLFFRLVLPRLVFAYFPKSWRIR